MQALTDRAEAKPRLLVSACFGFRACRYDGRMLHEQRVAELIEDCDVVVVCPEESIGLGTPRPTIVIVAQEGEERLVQPSTGRDLSVTMSDFSQKFLTEVGPLDGAILKARSPSCGVGDAKVVGDFQKQEPVGLRDGFFAATLRSQRPGLPVLSEENLKNCGRRQQFAQQIRKFARLRTRET